MSRPSQTLRLYNVVTLTANSHKWQPVLYKTTHFITGELKVLRIYVLLFRRHTTVDMISTESPIQTTSLTRQIEPEI